MCQRREATTWLCIVRGCELIGSEYYVSICVLTGGIEITLIHEYVCLMLMLQCDRM
jgi:hypothetical protein